ncbi:hypothetical protein EVAR_83511_1 [Eumeta japonica]|uniref:Uncharacterized protein n=1 Tax=Eumeta variegata TaxID=151549 RepID=A0A4C1XYT7_EUMVA|nr:hypothetical protein EVAR_83511_1 [Eumeta japonica]
MEWTERPIIVVMRAVTDGVDVRVRFQSNKFTGRAVRSSARARDTRPARADGGRARAAISADLCLGLRWFEFSSKSQNVLQSDRLPSLTLVFLLPHIHTPYLLLLSLSILIAHFDTAPSLKKAAELELTYVRSHRATYKRTTTPTD